MLLRLDVEQRVVGFELRERVVVPEQVQGEECGDACGREPKARSEVVPGPVSVPTEPTQMPLSLDGAAIELEVLAKHPTRHPWAWLLQRVFAVDIMTCPRCRGAMRLVKIANKPADIARMLADLGLGARPPPRPRPAATGQLELDFAV